MVTLTSSRPTNYSLFHLVSNWLFLHCAFCSAVMSAYLPYIALKQYRRAKAVVSARTKECMDYTIEASMPMATVRFL